MSNDQNFNRRNFLKSSTLGLVGAGVMSQAKWSNAQEGKKPEETEEPKIVAYRTLGRTGFKASDISTGGPMNAPILKALIDSGVNYIDTAESYGRGASEKTVGEVLKEVDRKSLFITSKLVLKDDLTKEGILDRFNKCLERLETDYLDCMMIHSPAKVETIKAEGFHTAMKQLKADGKLRFVGVSNHGSQWNEVPETMEQVLLAAAEDGRFDVMLLVYNFIQQEQGKRILSACREKNIGTTLMKTNPVGGYLGIKAQVEAMEKEGKDVPEMYRMIMTKLKEVADKADAFVKKHNLQNNNEIRDAAIKFVLSNTDVNSVCISFRNFEDVGSYIKLSGSTLNRSEEKKLAAFREGCSQLYCRHACGRCEASCPSQVPVNTIMRYNHYFEAQGREKHAMMKYADLTTAKGENCLNCSGNCQAACPYDVPIQGLMALAHKRLTLV